MISLIGFENQTEADRDMPLRVLGYDGADYRNQLSAKGGLYPVVTLVLYFGESPWTEPRSLYERVSVPEALSPFVNDSRRSRRWGTRRLEDAPDRLDRTAGCAYNRDSV